MKNTIKEVAIGAAIGAGLMASFLWVGLDMHLPEREEVPVVEAAEAEALPELETIDPVEIRELRRTGTEIEEAVQETVLETGVEAVAAAQSDLDLLAAIVYAEAGDQDFVGQRLVADVVLNRVHSPEWPNTVSGVIYQPGQFSPVTDGGLDRAWGRVTPSCYEAAQLALAGDHIDTQVIYFSMWGCANGVFAFQHGDHYFGY